MRRSRPGPASLALLVVVVLAMGLSSRVASAFSKASKSPDAHRLVEWLHGRQRIVSVTGAGLSTESGIPDYRGPQGSYARGHKPMVHDEFIRSPYHRSRYWARSMIGYHRFADAKPNDGHRGLAKLETDMGVLKAVITQNVDGLHQKAGSEEVIDLHGRNDRVVCMSCGRKHPRRPFQAELERRNAAWVERHVPREGLRYFADGDADLQEAQFEEFEVPACEACGGILKPDVVFFGDVVPQPRVDDAFAKVAEADAVLVAGTSLMVYSGWRFVLDASKRGVPICVVNQGHTRAEKEGIEHLKLEAACGEVLMGAAELLAGGGSSSSSSGGGGGASFSP